MADLVDLIRQIIQAELSRQPSSCLGVVEAVEQHAADSDTVNYGCDVRLRGRDAVLSSVPLATPHIGTVAPPQVGDLVLVQFVAGETAQPVVVGRFYSDAMRPPPYAAGEIHTILPPDAAESDRVEFSLVGGKNGNRSIALKLPGDVSLTVTDKKIQAVVKGLSLTIEDGSKIRLKTGGAEVSVADGGDVEVKANGNLTLKAQGNLEITAGGNLKLNANGTADLKGAVVNIN